MAYDRDRAAAFFSAAKAAGLSGSELLADFAAVMRDCNGIGADWMPKAMRELCTALNPVMEIPAAIHDRRYAIGGTAPGRLFADNEFRDNCRIMTVSRYGWWNPLRYIMLRRVNRYYGYLRTFGGIAYGGTQA